MYNIIYWSSGVHYNTRFIYVEPLFGGVLRFFSSLFLFLFIYFVVVPILNILGLPFF